jgi:hypothetical protein
MYSVVTNDFVATPRDGYYTFGEINKANDTEFFNTYVLYAQSFIDFVKDVKVLNDPPLEQYSTQKITFSNGTSYSAKATVPSPSPVAVVTPAPVLLVTPAPVLLVTPAPVLLVTPAPVLPVTPAPVLPVTPAPVRPVTPAPVLPVTPAPVLPVTPAPVRPVTPAPVLPVTPAPVLPVSEAPVAPPSPGYPVCVVCGADKKVTLPDVLVTLPGQEPTLCKTVETGGLMGFIEAQYCPIMPSLILACACA